MYSRLGGSGISSRDEGYSGSRLASTRTSIPRHRASSASASSSSLAWAILPASLGPTPSTSRSSVRVAASTRLADWKWVSSARLVSGPTPATIVSRIKASSSSSAVVSAKKGSLRIDGLQRASRTARMSVSLGSSVNSTLPIDRGSTNRSRPR